eukprot:scaffold253792_cov19-Tisochrysis_lutea.AAC.2
MIHKEQKQTGPVPEARGEHEWGKAVQHSNLKCTWPLEKSQPEGAAFRLSASANQHMNDEACVSTANHDVHKTTH